MASGTSGVRPVRCPKCSTLLLEFASVPVYRCGGCDTILRAKDHVAAIAGAMSSGSLENGSRSLSESIPEVNRPVPCSSDIDRGAESLESSDPAVSNLGNGTTPEPMEECRDRAVEVAEERSEMSTEAERKSEERVQIREGHSLHEQMENPMHPCQQDYGNSASEDKVEQSSECIGIVAALSVDGMKLTDGNSHSYSGSVSSSNGGGDNRLVSKRTYSKKVLDSVDSEEKEAKVEGQKIPEKLVDEKADLAIRENCVSNRDEFPSRPHIPAVERDSAIGSQDVHSVQNRIESETDDGASKSLSRDLPLPNENQEVPSKLDRVEPDPSKILRKMDELRDELSIFMTETAERRRTSQFKHRLSHIPSSGQPPYFSRLRHPYKLCYHADLPAYIQEDQLEGNGVDKLPRKEKKLAVKSYCRPVTGGAPFVVCYRCWKLLQLPADFLVTRKRLHKLQCGACHKVLVFSFRPRARTAPMSPVEIRHPPSEADNINDRVGRDPVPYSYDCGMSSVQSYSSKDELVLHVSRSSSYSNQGRRDGQDMRPQLHHLMGYSSARELLFRSLSVSEGYQSSEASTPRFHRPAHENMRNRLSGAGNITPNSVEIEENDLRERLKNRKRGSALQGLLKKGVRELSHGMQSMKMKIHSNG